MKLAVLLVAWVLSAPIAEAKLPPPTPQALAAEQEKRVQEEARLQREKALLEKAQDRVAERYRGERPAQPAGGVSAASLPNTVKQAPAPPQSGRDQSAEAHSAPAR
jgi:hypothetical protein